MPAQLKIFPERRLVVSKGEGTFTPADYTGQIAELLKHPEFKPDFDHLVDCRSISELAVNGEQVRTLGSRSAFGETSRRAFVVSSEVQYGLSRMLATYRGTQSTQQIQIFREMSEALAWLGLPADFDAFANNGSSDDTGESAPRDPAGH